MKGGRREEGRETLTGRGSLHQRLGVTLRSASESHITLRPPPTSDSVLHPQPSSGEVYSPRRQGQGKQSHGNNISQGLRDIGRRRIRRPSSGPAAGVRPTYACRHSYFRLRPRPHNNVLCCVHSSAAGPPLYSLIVSPVQQSMARKDSERAEDSLPRRGLNLRQA